MAKITNSKKSTYSQEHVLEISYEIFNLSIEKKYQLIPFVHSLLFCVEALQKGYGISHQDIAHMKRLCRNYISENEIEIKK